MKRSVSVSSEAPQPPKGAAADGQPASYGDVEEMFEKTRANLRPVTGLVNNAAGEGSQGRVEDLDADATQRLFEVNILGPFLCTQAAVKQMSTRFGGQGGAIVNISSAAARHGGGGTMSTTQPRRRQ